LFSYVFTLFNEYRGVSVKFGHGKRSRTSENGSVEIKGLSELREVLYVKNLKANLLYIS